MAIPVSVAEVETVLRPWLGTIFLQSCPLADELAQTARAYSPYRQTLAELRDVLEHQLITSFSRYTQGSMCVADDRYRAKRLTLRDVAWITDDVMGLVFDKLTVFSANAEKLNEYALRHESLAALRALCGRYATFFTAEQVAFMRQMVRQIYPPWRYEAWLPKEGTAVSAPSSSGARFGRCLWSKEE